MAVLRRPVTERPVVVAAAPGWRPSALLVSLVGLVLVPSLASWVYLAFLASDQFQAEARFAVRSAQVDMVDGDKSKSAATTVASGGSASLAEQDAYVVTTYVHSLAAIEAVSKDIDVRTVFTRPEADFWARLSRNASAEALLKYWNSMVGASVDGPSGIVTVSVRAFRPQDCVDVATSILKVSETLVNKLSAKAREDSVRRAELEVQRAETAVNQTLDDMRDYRDQAGFIDPTAAATSTSQLLTQVTAQKLQIESDLFVAKRSASPEAPQIKVMQTRLTALDQQITDLKAQLTGDPASRSTIAASLTRFEEIELHRQFTEKLYTMAQDALERAKAKAERQNVYVSVFVQPWLPEEAQYPERLALSMIIPLTLLVLWGIGALTVAAVNDHRL